jgi:D-sedoheptulose 7-phosphate isomerase
VSDTLASDALALRLQERVDAGRRFFGGEAERLAVLCHRMAERFASGGRLIALGEGGAGRSDARHVAVEFVHPVIVGKRALPALGLAGEGGPLTTQADLVCEAGDIVMGFGTERGSAAAGDDLAARGDVARGAADDDLAAPGDVARGAAGDDLARAAPGDDLARALALARERGCLTVAFGAGDPEWAFLPPSDDPFVRQELVETLYHVLWELVHVFFDHRGLLEGREARRTHDTGASSFLYPFLAEAQDDLEAVLADVRGSIVMKAQEVAELRAQTLTEGREALVAAAAALRACLDGGGRLLALGNGGSATDAIDVVADFREPPASWPRRRALDLTEDPGILTAIANDVGVEAIFARQVIAHGREGDALLALSTSGNSANVIAALAEARRRGLTTVAMVGYDGGRVADERLADHVVVTRSQHIPRIQEAQASAYHVLRELVEAAG